MSDEKGCRCQNCGPNCVCEQCQCDNCTCPDCSHDAA